MKLLFRKALAYAVRCRCPNCHEGPVFRGWFNQVLPQCPRCGLSYFRESGYYVGGMIITYVLTAAVIVTTFLLSLLFPDVGAFSINAKIIAWIGFGIVVATLLVRPAYSLWLTLDFWIDPWTPKAKR